MFYSHEVLTSRKYGVATVWLVATLGQKSTARKVSRRAILDVNVTKACNIIITPDAPMALRLQSSLLYGISRVYSEQCGYVLTDAQNAQNAMRALLRVMKSAALDLPAAKARPEQITLQDDPTFMPGVDFGALSSDLLDLEIGVRPQRYASDSASLHTSQSQQSAVFSQVGLQLPSSSSGIGGDDGFMMPGSGSRGHGPSSILAREDADVLLPNFDDMDIALDAEGNFIELGDVPAGRPLASSGVLPSDGGVGSRDGAPGHLGGAQGQDAQDDYLPPIDDGYDLPPPEERNLSDEYRGQQDRSEDMGSASSALAPQRRKARGPKVIPLDRGVELHNSHLKTIIDGYAERMTDDWKRVATGKNNAQAKKNADYWLLGRGIGGVGDSLTTSGGINPLAEMWSGDNLYFMLTGKERVKKGTKRESEGEGEASSPERRVRPRLDQDAPLFQDGGDDTLMRDYDELEVGREAQDPLEDMSSAMPWNVSASIRGSSVPRGSAVPGSAAGSLTRRNRMVSASPLVGRDLLSGGAGEMTSPAPFNDFGGLVESDAFELYGPGAQVDTQTAGESQWQKAVLDKESNNFLEFIGNAIGEKRTAAGLDTEDAMDVDFEELLPSKDNSKTVAAQALLHVLTLRTKNLIRATQKEPFAGIVLEVI